MPEPITQLLDEAERHGCRPELVAAINLADDFAGTLGRNALDTPALKVTWLCVLAGNATGPLQLLILAAATTAALDFHARVTIEGIVRRNPAPDSPAGLDDDA